MCGILASISNNSFDSSFFEKFDEALKIINHRGPDGKGIYAVNTNSKSFTNSELLNTNDSENIKPNLALGHVRLSIIDTSIAGHQPLHYMHYSITFNGEIYNYIELRDELKQLGYTFKTQTDTEVILAAYDCWKEKCLEKFNGMFTIIIYDSKINQLFVANDRYGVKPLYYYQNESQLIFVSEIKQFKPFNLKLTLNNNTISTFLTTYFIDYNEETFYNEIKRFPKSHYSILKLDKLTPITFNNYYKLSLITKINSNCKEEFNYLFNDAVKLRMRSDVPIGFASSGGLDSSSILYKAYYQLKEHNTHQNINTFSAIFPEMDGDESEFIHYIEKDLQIKSHYVNPLTNFSITDFEKHIYHQDLPISSTSYYAEWCVARLVNQSNVKVLLIGQGGDELLAGYHHHFYRYCRQLILQAKIGTYLSVIKSYAELKSIPVNTLHRLVLNDIKLVVKLKLGLEKTHHSLQTHWNKANTLIELLKIDFTELMLPNYLRADDRDAMAFGLETRHPFLDYRLVDFCFSLPDNVKINKGWQKALLREAMTELPEKIRCRKDKKGYTTPQKLWEERHKLEFENYHNYIPKTINQNKTIDPFLNTALGAWFKMNALN